MLQKIKMARPSKYFRIFPSSTDPRAGETFGEMQSMKSLAVGSDPDATRQRPITELEGLLHRALCKIRDPVETAAEVTNFCNGLLRRRKRLERSVCQEALARLQGSNLNDANLEEAESVRELQRPRAVDVKVVVHELEDPWAYAAAKYPNLDWRLKLKMEFSGYHQLLQRCRQHVVLGLARANTVDFAKLAAAQLVPVVHVPVEGGEKRTTYKSFEKGGFWLVRNWDDLGQTVEDLMCKMCCPVFEPMRTTYRRRPQR